MEQATAALGDNSNQDEAVRRQLIDGYVAARDVLDDAIAGLTPETACGGWSVLEISAHVAAWERYSAKQMVALASGIPEPPVDVDEMNAAAAVAARSAPADQSMAAYAASRRLFVDCLERLPAAAFQLAPVRDHVAMEVGHCAEHAAELRALATGDRPSGDQTATPTR
jgi:hypothetical protein